GMVACGADAIDTALRTQTARRPADRSHASRTAWGSGSRSWSPTTARRQTTSAASSSRPGDSATPLKGYEQSFFRAPHPPKGEGGLASVSTPLPAHPLLQAQVRLLRLQRFCGDGPAH